MFRVTFGFFALVVLASGCCGPMGCGPGCNLESCYDCDGASMAESGYGYHPFESLIGLRKKIVCGSGCGETYYGEWMSTPPDCEDPCHGDQFVGGAVTARPFCWAPGTIWGAIVPNLYGGRMCESCGESYVACDCGDAGCAQESAAGGGCGCASCDASHQPNATRMAHRPPTHQRASTRTPGRR